MVDRVERKARFIRQLAEFLVDGQAGKSIALQVESEAGGRSFVQWAKQWAALRSETPLRGYPTVDEAEKELLEFLG